MKKIILIASIVGAIAIVVNAFSSYQPAIDKANTQAVVASPQAASAQADTYSLAEVATHATSSDCYMAISGAVYDVTPYINSRLHPGGNMILKGCGSDATQLFTGQKRGGHFHSQVARAVVAKYKIGTLAN